MLVDLDWTNPDPDRFVDWDATNGSLSFTTVYHLESGKEERYPYRAAVRVGRGVYAAHGLDHHVRMFTAWDVVFTWGELKALYDEMVRGLTRTSASKPVYRWLLSTSKLSAEEMYPHEVPASWTLGTPESYFYVASFLTLDEAYNWLADRYAGQSA